MGIFQRLRAAVARSPTAAQVKMVTETGNGLYVYDGNLYKSDIVRACIRPKIKAVGKATPRHIRTTIGPDGKTNTQTNPDPYNFSYEFAPGRIVWDKCKKGTSFSDCELAATDLFNTVRLFRFMWNGMLQGKSVAEGHIMQGNKKLNEQRIHPTQKPVALYDWIFQNYAAPGCRVLDTHLGSGSSRIAAYEAGVDFIGFEIDPIYYAAEEQRFLDYTSQTSLFHLT